MALAIRSKALAAAIAGMAVLAAGTGPASANRSGYCNSYARDVANSNAGAGDVLAGTVGGALGGAIIGGIIDNGRGAGRGAAIGAVGGTVVGAAATNDKWHRIYNRAYNDCMASNAVARQPAYTGGAPRPGTRAWYDYCAAKYRSFNPQTGTYTAYSGKSYPCR
jgi:hypothetical protein